jgi:hypothetical protein
MISKSYVLILYVMSTSKRCTRSTDRLPHEAMEAYFSERVRALAQAAE